MPPSVFDAPASQPCVVLCRHMPEHSRHSDHKHQLRPPALTLMRCRAISKAALATPTSTALPSTRATSARTTRKRVAGGDAPRLVPLRQHQCPFPPTRQPQSGPCLRPLHQHQGWRIMYPLRQDLSHAYLSQAAELALVLMCQSCSWSLVLTMAMRSIVFQGTSGPSWQMQASTWRLHN